jgi:hypothetical protein
MEILLPDNIFARILSSVFTEKELVNLHLFPSGLLSKKINEIKNSVGLIPTMDLLNHKDFFVSRSVGISFDESICNSYLYFNNEEQNLKEIALAGDVSTNEAVLTKILFSENYGINVQLSFEKPNGASPNKNRILVGDRNFSSGNFETGISFAEEMIELISAPYINFVFASESEEALKKFHSKYQGIISVLNPTEVFENTNEAFASSSKNYLSDNLQHVVFSFDEQDLEGIKQLLQLPYYHGIIKDMIDVKFV